MTSQMVSTNNFELEEKVYFKILIRTRLLDLWWFYVILILLVFWNLEDFGDSRFSTYMVILGCLYPISGFFYLYYLATSKKNQSILQKRSMQFDDSYILTQIHDGTENKVPFSKIVQVTETRTFFLLYLTKSQFIYVPKNSFKNEKDLSLFAERVKSSMI